PYKCPPSPNESAFMLDEFFTKAGKRSKVSITYLTPYLRLYSAEAINEVIEPIYRKRNIASLTGFNVESVDPDRKEVISMEGDRVKYDALFLVPPHTGSDVVKGEEYADDDGWIKTDKWDLHIKDYDYAFAIGDGTNLPISKAGVEAHLEAVVVSGNIINSISGTSDRYLFTGRLQCSMETGYRQATFVIGTYEKPVEKIYPSFKNYMEKKFMERIYWASLVGKYEWLFKWHFGEDYYKVANKGEPGIAGRAAKGV
ncbi:MAG: FAD/NAD(P)-binding oxidoreductase, partial [Thermoplasmataceae archaeon]